MTIIESLTSIGNKNKILNRNRLSLYNINDNSNTISSPLSSTTTAVTNIRETDLNSNLWGRIISILGVMFSNKSC